MGKKVILVMGKKVILVMGKKICPKSTKMGKKVI